MSYCEKCGNQISENSKFCPGCGEQQNNNSPDSSISADRSFPYVSPGRSYIETTNNVIFRTGYSNRLFTRWIILCFIQIISTFAAVCIINISISHLENVCREYKKYHGRYSASYYETAKEVISLLDILRTCTVIFSIGIVCIYIIKCFQIRQNSLAVTKDGINGIACPSLGFGTLNFNIRFNQIASVIVKSGHITFTTTLSNKKYHCCVEDYLIARQIIKKILIGE